LSDFVLDASALLALIQAEPGAERVAEVLERAAISAINLAEVVARTAERGLPAEAIRGRLERLDLGVVPVDEDLAYATGLLRPATRRLGLSLDDRGVRRARPQARRDRADRRSGLGRARCGYRRRAAAAGLIDEASLCPG
jgi:ribonuclease VapC